MLWRAPQLSAELFTQLPESLYYQGEPNEWVRTTRPGQRIHSFLEGPTFDADGRMWIVDVPYGRIFSIDPDGAWRLAYSYGGEPHAIRLMEDGRFALTDYRNGLLTFDPDTNAIETLCDRSNTERFRGLSDLSIGLTGDIWFTDSGRTSLSDPTGRLYRRRIDATLDLVLSNIPYPNGVALSPDGQFVYVAATRANAVWRLLADAPDPVWPMTGTFVQLSGGLGPDGLAVDRHGRLAVAHAQAGRAWLFDAIGDPLAEIPTPAGPWVTSVAFGGEHDQFLYIIEARTGSVLRADLSRLEP